MAADSSSLPVIWNRRTSCSSNFEITRAITLNYAPLGPGSKTSDNYDGNDNDDDNVNNNDNKNSLHWRSTSWYKLFGTLFK